MMDSIRNFISSWSWTLDTPAGGLAAFLAGLAVIFGFISLLRVRLVHNIFLAIPALYLFVIGLLGRVLWSPASWLARAIQLVLPVNALIDGLLALSKRLSRGALVHEERRYVAELYWPPALYPDLYQNVPSDIMRPVFEDGRLLGGIPLTWLADREFNAGAFRSFMRSGLTAGMVLLVLLIATALAIGLLDGVNLLFHYLTGDRPVIERWPGQPQGLMSDAEAAATFKAIWAAQISDLTHWFLRYLPGQIAMMLGVWLLAGLLLLNRWFDEVASPYMLVTKDAEVRWPYRIETRNLLRETYLRQVALATGYLKNAKTFSIGTATGTLRARGDLAAPTRGQTLKLDEESLFQHTLVFGGTGEGKTSAVLKPLMRQILADKKFGAFVSDAKGVLWRDAAKVANDVKRAADVIMIGTGDKHLGVNITSGLTPAQISAALRSVLTQISASEGESFWPDMAAGIIRHMLSLGQAFAKTDAGVAASIKGPNPYSLWWAYQAVLRQDVMKDAITQIRAARDALKEKAKSAANDADLQKTLDEDRGFWTAELRDTVIYLESAWSSMATETKTGIIANVTQLLDGFASAPILRERFVSGRDENCITMRDALDGKIVVNTLSSIEDGLPARLVSILIKTSLYREARQREADWKKKGTQGKPQDRPCLVVMDEVQELATSDASSGLSDASFWNVARSSGLAGLFATQTITALNQALGDDAASNFIQQARSKIFFRTEEKETVEYACWCAGSFERNRVYGQSQRESLEYRWLIDGWDPMAEVSDEFDYRVDPRELRKSAWSLFSPTQRRLNVASARDVYEPDFSFVPTETFSGADPGASANATYLAAMQAQQAAVWRSEDLKQKYLSEGNETEAALTSADFLHMGRWHAFAHIQRAGALRQDLVQVIHDFS